MDSNKLLAAVQRFFAAETNNAAWSLAEQDELPDDQRDACVATAFASLMHWSAVGTPAHVARANGTVARALLVHGRDGARLALRHAERYLAGATEAWDEVFAHIGISRARAALGDYDAAREARTKAHAALGRVTEEEDREICSAELARGPWFDLDAADR